MSHQEEEWPKPMTGTITRWCLEEATEARLQVFIKKNNWVSKLTLDEGIH